MKVKLRHTKSGMTRWKGERLIYKAAKPRTRSRRNTGDVNVIKDQIGGDTNIRGKDQREVERVF